MISKNIILEYTNLNLQFNNNIGLLDQNYLELNSNNIRLFSDINYNIYLEQTSNNEIYYIVMTENHVLNKKTITVGNVSYTYYYGISDLIFENNTLKIKKQFKLNEVNSKYNYYLFKLTKTGNNVNYDNNVCIKSDLLIIDYPLIYLKLDIVNLRVGLDITDNMSNLNKDNIVLINENDELKHIILHKNNNYLFYINNLTKIDIYNESIINYDLESVYNANSYLSFIKINKNQRYKWNITNSNLNISGNLYVRDIYEDLGNNEIVEDNIFKNISIGNKIYYNEFIYNEYKNIIRLNNNINYLGIEYSNKVLIVDRNSLFRLELILPSKNIEVGIVYKILLLSNFNSINIKCEDNEDNINDFDVFKGLINISNINSKKIKSILPDFTVNNNIKTIDLNNHIILKNKGILKYGYINLYCINKINNKFIWNIESNLLNDNNENINNLFI